MQGNESVLVTQLREKISSLDSEQKSAKQIAEENFAEIEVILIQHKKYYTQKYNRKMQHQN